MSSPLVQTAPFVLGAPYVGLRLDSALREYLPTWTRNRLQKAIQAGYISINGGQAKASYQVRLNDLVKMRMPPSPCQATLLPEAIPLAIVYEDGDLVVVNKAAEMVVHPAHGHWQGTLVQALLYHLGTLPAQPNNPLRPGLVHRIDKGTSGLLVVAKHEAAMSELASQFSDHSIERVYHALVWGSPAKGEGTIDLPIGRSLRDRRMMVVYPAGAKGKRAVTHYKVMELFGYTTLLSCRLETGRTHQIRAHMHYLGHPLVGDGRYGGAQVVKGPSFAKYGQFVRNGLDILPYQALHAYALGFLHPRTKQRCYFQAPHPPAFAKVVTRWRNYAQATLNPKFGCPKEDDQDPFKSLHHHKE